MKSKVFIVACVMVFFTLSSSLTAFSQTSTEQNKTVAQDQKEQTIKLKVSGITCGGDIKDIESVVNKLKGITAIKSDKPAATSIFQVTFNPAVVTEKEIRTAVEGTPGCTDPDSRPYKVK